MKLTENHHQQKNEILIFIHAIFFDEKEEIVLL